MRTHRELDAWKLGIDLADLVYEVTKSFPADEKYGLVSQMRRAAVSNPTNIAEGAARETTKDYRRFLFISRGSLAELETLIVIASRAGILAPETETKLRESRDRAAQTLQGLIRSLHA